MDNGKHEKFLGTSIESIWFDHKWAFEKIKNEKHNLSMSIGELREIWQLTENTSVK